MAPPSHFWRCVNHFSSSPNTHTESARADCYRMDTKMDKERSLTVRRGWRAATTTAGKKCETKERRRWKKKITHNITVHDDDDYVIISLCVDIMDRKKWAGPLTYAVNGRVAGPFGNPSTRRATAEKKVGVGWLFNNINNNGTLDG